MLALVVVLIVYGSLYPWHFDFSRGHGSPLWILLQAWPDEWNRFVIRDAGVNVVLYAPLGAAACWRLARRCRGMWAVAGAVLLATGLSASMEMLQVYVPGRTCSLLDLVTNTVGGMAGGLAGWVFRRDWEKRLQAVGRAGALAGDAGAAILLAGWVGYQLYPFFPLLSRTRLRWAVGILLHGAPIQPVEVWANAAEWFAATVLLEACLWRWRWGWPLVGMGCSVARLVMASRTLAGEEVLGAALGLALWSVMKEGWRPAAGAWWLGSAILLRELAPFRLADFPAPFWWIPFAASFNAERQAGLLVMLRKAFDYGALIWLLAWRGAGRWRAGAAVAAALLVCEWAQRYLAGRTAETTDSVLAMLMAGILGMAARQRHTSNL